MVSRLSKATTGPPENKKKKNRNLKVFRKQSANCQDPAPSLLDKLVANCRNRFIFVEGRKAKYRPRTNPREVSF